MNIEINKIYNIDCIEGMYNIEDNSIDLIVTSPPYWNQRSYSYWETYEDYMVFIKDVIHESYRVLKPGRHTFWIIPDKLPFPPKDNKSKERLYMPVYNDSENIAQQSGYICEFPIIWDKRGPNLSEQPWSKKMWGSYPYPIGIIHTPFTERICVWRKPGKHGLTQNDRQDSMITSEQFNDWARDIWSIRIESGIKHPAPFPFEIANRIITLWSRKQDLVLDPFIGSGTVALAAKQLDRNFIGFEIEQQYIDVAIQRLQN